ncbi:glycosyltransferase [Aeromonas caviae]|uniref:glycosyltransferase family protein n=1 Tax=Aeromonas caviae TaxID=648 RepID=UPI00244A6436|nr:glycosyltransferase [Aeromonas caviae]MDH1845591.1 glycosyltransferase [Aeromonas caviae]
MKQIKPRHAKKKSRKQFHVQSELALPQQVAEEPKVIAEREAKEAEDQAEALTQEIHGLKTQLNEARLKYRHVTQTYGAVKQELGAAQSELAQIGGLREEAAALALQLKQMRQQLEIAQARLKAESLTLTELKRTNLKNRIALGEKELALAEAEQKLLKEKERVLRVRNHLSYRLGHALIQSGKSWRELLALPSKLLQLRGDAKSRRQLLVTSQRRAEVMLPQLSGELMQLKRELHQLPALDDATKLQSIKIACVMDTFTYQSYAPEACLLQLTPDNWRAELEAFVPDMLFIESAWRGKDDLWGNKVGHTSQELVGIVNWCNQHKVTTLFWNKEDPIHFETFLNTAKLFDHIFTTDIDCIARYKKALGHEQVYFLPFAAQPRVNNPVEKYQRQDKFCFAGAYYVKYPDRTRDLNNFVVNLPEYRDIDIYDRNFGKNDPNYMFPEEYQPYIVGTLPYDQIDKAYKGYNYAINLNSIKQSQSMFARRVFELLASNTVTVSNFSHGLRLMFGDLVCTSDSGEEIVSRLQQLTGDALKLKQFRLQALRKIMSEHTYQDRMNYIHSKLSGTEVLPVLPSIKVFAYVKNSAALESLVHSFERQAYSHKSLTLVLSGVEVSDEWRARHDAVELLTPLQADALNLNKWLDNQWLACMVPEDYYGEHYLTDLALATRYTGQLIIGKKACFRWQDGLIQSFPNAEYKEVGGLTPRQSLISALVLPEVSLCGWLTTVYTWQSDEPQFGIDSLNYCMGGAGHCESLPEFSQSAAINTGLSLMEMQSIAEAMAPASLDISQLSGIRPDELAQLFRPGRDSQCVAALADGKLQIASSLPDGKHEYWYSNRDFTLSELGVKRNKLNLHLEATPGLNLQVVILFLDEKKQRISHTLFPANKNSEIQIPAGTQLIRPGFRVYASGSTEVSNFYLEEKPSSIPTLITKSKYLVLTNNYPSYSDLYKNGFVHSRVVAYREQGIECDIFRFNKNESLVFDEYKNIKKLSGGKEELKVLLESNQYKSILVHFLDRDMWQVLSECAPEVKIVVWVHGAEIHPWYRRKYNYMAEQDLTKIKSESEARMEFWKGLLKQKLKNLKLIFVSNTFKKEVFEDLGFSLDDSQYSIIHNPINTDTFSYTEKDVEQRKKILSIRPFASRQYANDISVKAIFELSKYSIFDELSFTIIGDGVLFEETIDSIKDFENVTIFRKFVNHEEIAELHKEHGLFLCPTRWDSQGVSRDEAMSSGLVPLTTRIAAIPEFVDDRCAVLSEPEDISGIVNGIVSLYHEPEKFESMSKAAHLRIESNLCKKIIIEREIAEFKQRVVLI